MHGSTGGVVTPGLGFTWNNIMNTANFQPPDGNFGSTTFGSISSTGNAIPRQMEFALKYLF